MYGVGVFGVCENGVFRGGPGGDYSGGSEYKILFVTVRLTINHKFKNTSKNAILPDFRRPPGSYAPESRQTEKFLFFGVFTGTDIIMIVEIFRMLR
jgi:hypothetical protein